MKTVAIIPARGGSKRIPRKNIVDLAGKPLISYIIQTAIKSQMFDRIIVSTDDEEIAKVANQCGAETPFLRPIELAGDYVPEILVLQHAVNYLENKEGYYPEIIVRLNPTAPLCKLEDIKRVIEKIVKLKIDAVEAVCEVQPHDHPYAMLKLEKDGYLKPFNKEGILKRMQDFDPVYKENGSIFAVTRDCLIEKNTMYGDKLIGIVVKESLDIDTFEDLKEAERIIKNDQKNSNRK